MANTPNKDIVAENNRFRQAWIVLKVEMQDATDELHEAGLHLEAERLEKRFERILEVGDAE